MRVAQRFLEQSELSGGSSPFVKRKGGHVDANFLTVAARTKVVSRIGL
jgi:hypothetical protein